MFRIYLSSVYNAAALLHTGPRESKDRWIQPLPLLCFKVLIQSEHSKMILIWTACYFHLPEPLPGGRHAFRDFINLQWNMNTFPHRVSESGGFAAGQRRRTPDCLFLIKGGGGGEAEKMWEFGNVERIVKSERGRWVWEGWAGVSGFGVLQRFAWETLVNSLSVFIFILLFRLSFVCFPQTFLRSLVCFSHFCFVLVLFCVSKTS